MDCKITSTRSRQAAFTLSELMIASAIASVIATSLSALVAYSGRSFAAMANYVSLDRASRNALDVMSREIRQANRLTSASSTNLVFEDFDGGTLEYAYEVATKTLKRKKDGVTDTKPLLTECDHLQFSTFQRNPIGGSYGVYPNATPETCKLVQLQWICSREIFGMKVNTESVQSSKIVIRKQ